MQSGRHFRPFLSARRSLHAVGPSFSAIFGGLIVVDCSPAIIFGHFWRLGCHCLQSGHHFRPFLSARLSLPAVGPSFSAIFGGSAVIACSRTVIFGHFWRPGGRCMQSGRHFRPFLAARLSICVQLIEIGAGAVFTIFARGQGPSAPWRPFRPQSGRLLR